MGMTGGFATPNQLAGPEPEQWPIERSERQRRVAEEWSGARSSPVDPHGTRRLRMKRLCQSLANVLCCFEGVADMVRWVFKVREGRQTKREGLSRSPSPAAAHTPLSCRTLKGSSAHSVMYPPLRGLPRAFCLLPQHCKS